MTCGWRHMKLRWWYRMWPRPIRRVLVDRLLNAVWFPASRLWKEVPCDCEDNHG